MYQGRQALNIVYLPINYVILNIRDRNYFALIENLTAEDYSTSEVDEVGDDFIPEISDHDTDTDTDISNAEATTQALPRTENFPKSSSEDEDAQLSRFCYFRCKNNKQPRSFPSRASVSILQNKIILRKPFSNLTENDENDPYNI
ncbi:hypothetical protein HHI36_017104 [Cryptolaemus montrouzieri]|uniref:Uncharacterized protein n=1 Tax=Cryptolaemus montrouzieri TaxID=559131 RepID=A0ABD2NLL6_9CUCU